MNLYTLVYTCVSITCFFLYQFVTISRQNKSILAQKLALRVFNLGSTWYDKHATKIQKAVHVRDLNIAEYSKIVN